MTRAIREAIGPVDVVVDGDVFAFRAMAAHQRAVKWSPDVWSVYGDVGGAYQQFRRQVAAALDAADLPLSARVIVAQGDKDNFRKAVDPTYKANRKEVQKPVGLAGLWDRIAEDYTVVRLPGLEADDVVGILGTATDAFMLSSDKDFLGIPGRHLRLSWDENGIQVTELYVDRGEANRWHLIQTLAGDATDGYAGAPKVGPVTAAKLLDAPGDESPWERVVAAFVKGGLTEDDALRTARLAYILRADDYDFTTKTPRLWAPAS